MLRSSILRLREVSCFLSSSKSSIIVFVSINNRYCRLKSVLFSLFAQSFLKAPFFVRIVDRLQKIFEQVTERCDRIAYRTAFVCGECLSAVQAQRMVDFGETELPVDFRTVERVAVPGEDDALYVGCAAAHPELGSAAVNSGQSRQRGTASRSAWKISYFVLSGSRRRCSLTFSLPDAK